MSNAADNAGTAPNAAAAAPHPSLRSPRDAASIILLDRSAAEPRILMGRRSSRQVFFPDSFVFPGGSVDPRDGRLKIAAPLQPEVETRLLARARRPSPTRARAIAMAALRELAEETGMLIGRRDETATISGKSTWEPFSRAGVRPALDGLHLVARAVTPPGGGRKRRYDTRFFAADASLVVEQLDGFVGPDAEFSEICWVTIDETAQLPLPLITKIILRELARRLERGLEQDLPVPLYFNRRGVRIRDEI